MFKYCGTTYLRAASPAFHPACYNRDSLHIYNQVVKLSRWAKHTTNSYSRGHFNRDNFFISVNFDSSNEIKNNNQQIDTITEETKTNWSVKLNTYGTNILSKSDSGAQVNVIQETRIETLQSKRNITKSTSTLST